MDEKLLKSNVDNINSIFIKNFNNSYDNIHLKDKVNLLQYVEVLFYKWYSSAILENFVVSPANMVNALCDKREGDCVCIPSVYVDTTKKNNRLCTKINEYNVFNHPLVNDLFTILNYFDNEIVADGDFLIEEAVRFDLSDKLAYRDVYYISYIIKLADEVGLIEELDSIYTRVFLKTDYVNEFVKKDREEILEELIKCAIELTSRELSETFGEDEVIITPEEIYQWLENPITIDETFIRIYSNLDIDIEELWNMNIGDADELEGYILSTTYVLGILLDRCFLTPFGRYFAVIQPLYTLPYKFEEEIGYCCESLIDTSLVDMSDALFSPCTQYFTTKLGAKIFNTKRDLSIYDIYEKMPVDKMIEYFVESNKENMIDAFEDEEAQMMVWEIKIKFIDEKTYWKKIEIANYMTLEKVHMEICRHFSFDPKVEYSIFLNTDMSPFYEYVSPNKNTRNNKRTDKTTLLELNIEKGQKLIYKYNSDEYGFTKREGELYMELELFKYRIIPKGKFYTRVTGVSKAMREMEYFF